VLFTGTGIASLAIVGLIFSPVGSSYFLLFYIFGTVCMVALAILLFCFKQFRFEPDWPDIFIEDVEDNQSDELL